MINFNPDKVRLDYNGYTGIATFVYQGCCYDTKMSFDDASANMYWVNSIDAHPSIVHIILDDTFWNFVCS